MGNGPKIFGKVHIILSETGNTLAFVLIFLALLSFLTIPILKIFSYSTETTIKSKNALTALNLALQTMEEVKSKKFAEVASMLPTAWDAFEGEWISDENEKIAYPESYKYFKKQIIVRDGKDLPAKNPNIKEVAVNVKWEELDDMRRPITHSSIRLVTYISKENPND